MKPRARRVVAGLANCAELSTTAKTKSGVVYDATKNHWSFRDGVAALSINYDRLPAVSADIKLAVKRVMVVLLETRAPSGVGTYFGSLLVFLTDIARLHKPVRRIEGADYLNFSSRSRNARQSGHVKAMLRTWDDIGAPGLEDDLLPSLDRVKVHKPPLGVPVATMDPRMGPFTDNEFQALHGALNTAYLNEQIRPSIYVMTWLFAATGARPVQLSAMKVKDVHSEEVDGAIDYSIDVPRAKKGGPAREELKNRPLMKSIGELVVRYATTVRACFSERLDDPSEAPLFPMATSTARWAPGFAHHRDPNSLGTEIRNTLNALSVVSERTGKPMNITPIRFRRTLGTRAAQEGHGILIIAELLDHADTQSAGVYIETRPDIAQRIDKATALELAPIAQAFAGKLIRSEAEATRFGDSSSRIRDLRVSVDPLASCGQHSFCNMPAPIACYTCDSFEPWLDAPHESLLNRLLATRSRQLDTVHPRIATVHDRTILAVAQVVHLCRQGLAPAVPTNAS